VPEKIEKTRALSDERSVLHRVMASVGDVVVGVPLPDRGWQPMRKQVANRGCTIHSSALESARRAKCERELAEVVAKKCRIPPEQAALRLGPILERMVPFFDAFAVGSRKSSTGR